MLCTIRSYGQENEEILLPKENAKPKPKKLKILLVYISTGCGRLLTVMARLSVLLATTPLLSILRSRGHFALVKGLLCLAKQIGALVGSFWQNHSG